MTTTSPVNEVVVGPHDVVPVTRSNLALEPDGPPVGCWIVTPPSDYAGAVLLGEVMDVRRTDARNVFHTTAHWPAVHASGVLRPRRRGGFETCAPGTASIPAVSLTTSMETARAVANDLRVIAELARSDRPVDVKAATIEEFRRLRGNPRPCSPSQVAQIAALDPANVRVLSIPIEAVPTDALTLDVASGVYELEEWRVYGCIGVGGAEVIDDA